ncbi:MAG: M56 family metallopeptidase [Acidobacteriia bacterium]|nr:M56 family metallopeptidase [Terriglobia bacterium]
MTNITNWLSPAAMHSLGWALVHFLWQGTALAALAAVTMALCRRASARYVIGVGTLLLMLAAPAATFFLLTQTSSIASGKSPRLPDARTARTMTAAPVSAKPASSNSLPDALPWLVEAWLVGVAFFSLRTAGGFLLLERQQRKQSIAVNGRLLEICVTLQRRLGLDRAIRFCECQWLQAPAVIGWFRPVVLLPITALTGLNEDQLRTVIAHELAHIKRFDAFVNVFQICVETLLFYHPAVWWLNKRIRAEREHCCDDMAVSLCGNPVEYARALTLMEEWRTAPALAMAANRGPLSERIVRLLGLKSAGTTPRRVGLTGSVLCLAAALIAGNALVGIAFPKPIAYASGNSLLQLGFRPTSASAQARAAAQTAATPAAKPSPAQASRPAEQPATAQSYIDALKSAGLTGLTADQLIALKIQDVTPDYVRSMHELGMHPDADACIAMRVQGVTPEYIRELRSLGFTPDEEQIIALKVQDVNADYVRGLKEVGIQGDADQIIALKVQGVTPEYVRGMKEVGIQGDSDQMVALKVQEVTPVYVRELRSAGLTVDSDDVISLKVQGVTPAYVHSLQELGLKPSIDDVVGMRVQGVTPEYVRAIRALGLNPSADEIIGMQVQGVTPEFIKSLQSAGFKPSVDEVIGARVQGITPEFIDIARKHGFQNLTIEKLIELKHMGVLDAKGDI